jgi:PKHD-type hydroxylase
MNAPRYGIPVLSFPLLSYCELYNAFNPEQCQKIADLGELLAFQPGSVGENTIAKATRDSDVAWIDAEGNGPNQELRQQFIHQLTHSIAMVNRDKFQMDLDFFYPVQYTKYALNQHYDWHVDQHEGAESPEHRRLSAVLILSKPEDYEGGELELNINGNPDNTLKLKPAQGTLVFFPSSVPHRVLPVTSGNRASVVVWAMGPKPR